MPPPIALADDAVLVDAPRRAAPTPLSVDAVIVEEEEEDEDVAPAELVSFERRSTGRPSAARPSSPSGGRPSRLVDEARPSASSSSSRGSGAGRSLSVSPLGSFSTFNKTLPIFVDVDALVARKRKTPRSDENDDKPHPSATFLGDVATKLEALDYAPRFVATGPCRRVGADGAGLAATFGKDVETRFYRGLRGSSSSATWRATSSGDDDAPARLAAIRAWLREHTRAVVFLVIDGYDLCDTTVGSCDERGLSELHFVPADADTLSVDRAVTLVKQQARRADASAQDCADRFTEEEWAKLRDSPLSVDVLRKDTCPFWQIQAAQAYLRKLDAGHKKSGGRRAPALRGGSSAKASVHKGDDASAAAAAQTTPATVQSGGRRAGVTVAPGQGGCCVIA